MRRILALFLTVFTIAAGSPQEVPRFKSGVDVVQFTVTVLDKGRHPIAGLTASDFEALVDGKPAPLAAFAAVTLPDGSSTGVSVSTVAPDVHTSQLAAEGRLVVIVMDRSIPDGQPMQAAHTVANAAIDRLGPNDLAAVVYTGSASRKFSQDFTVDRARLHAAANQTTFGAVSEPVGPPSLTAFVESRGAAQPNQPVDRVQLASKDRGGACSCGICVLDTLTALATTLTGAMGRDKSIVFIGSDIAIAEAIPKDLEGGGGAGCARLIYPARDKLTRALDAANVTFHAVDPRGLESFGETAELDRPAASMTAGPDGEQHANAFRQSSLGFLADYTGGRLVVNSNTPERAISPIFDESRSYYVLAVARDATVSKKDDRHRISIRVKRKDAVVRARTLYYAAVPTGSAKRAPNPAAGRLDALLPDGNFSLQMNLASLFSKDGTPEVRVLLGADAAVAGKLDVLIRAFDHLFTPVGESVTQRLDVPASAVVSASTFQWGSTLKLPPGDYEVRAVVATPDGRHGANVIGYVDVPDVAKDGLALSGIVVKSGGAATVQREFGVGAAIELSFQVARAKSTTRTASVRYALRDAIGQAVADVEVPHERATPVAPGVDGYEIGIRLPAGPGRYVVTIEASDGRRTARREVPLTVR